MLLQFFTVFWDYLIEILPYLALGFFLSGLISEFVPTAWVEKHLGGRGIKPLLYATIAGTILPICCIGSLPVAVSFHQKGARLGPVLAFLVATPATSISALLVTYSLLGIKFTVFIFLAVILMGLIMGLIGNTLRVKPRLISPADETAIDPVCGMQVQTGNAPNTEHGGETYYFCCTHCQQEFEGSPEGFLGAHSRKLTHRIKHVLQYAFVDMPKDIGLEILAGIALAAVVVAITPVGEFVRDYFGGALGYLFSIVFGIMMYICATASVPLVDAFIFQGMNVGAGMTLLIVGPITSWGTILVIRKVFGNRTLLFYLAVIILTALPLGYLFSII